MAGGKYQQVHHFPFKKKNKFITSLGSVKREEIYYIIGKEWSFYVSFRLVFN